MPTFPTFYESVNVKNIFLGIGSPPAIFILTHFLDCSCRGVISLHMWETTVMHKQVSGWTVNFGPNFPESPFLELKTRKPPPHFRKLQIWDDQSLLQNTPHFRKLQIWDDQSLLRNTPPFWKTSDLGWPKFTPKSPPISENFRFGMIKVYSGIPPHFGKLQIWDDQSLLRNNPPPFQKTSDLGWPKFTPEYPPFLENFRFGMTKVYSKIPPPISENFRFGMTKVYSGIPPHFGKLQIWDDQSLLWNTPPPFCKTSDLGWPKFTPGYPPPFWKTSDLGWPKFTPESPPPPHFRKLQITDDQSLLRNNPPPISENFRFGMTKVYSGIPPQNENCQRVQVREFQNTESYYMWRLSNPDNY